MTIQIKLNGKTHLITHDSDLASLLSELRVNPIQVAVAKNLEVIPHSELKTTHVQNGDEIEIFQAVGGG